MKGFVFTLDAIFSLVFAAAAISALVYVSYSGYIPPSVQSSEVSSISGTLLSTNLQTLGQTSPLYGAGSLGTWPQYGATEGYSFGGTSGPARPYLLYNYTASASIIPSIAVSGGYAAFGAGSNIYEINATTGTAAYNYPVTNPSSIAGAPVIYNNYLIYANTTGYLVALSTSNGIAKAWKTSVGFSGKLTAPLQIEDGYVVVSGSVSGFGRLYFVSPSNGVVVESDQTALSGSGANVIWIAHRKGTFYIGQSSGKAFNGIAAGQAVNSSIYPSNSFASYGSFLTLSGANTVAMYANLTAAYSMTKGILNITSVPDYPGQRSSSFTLPTSTVNTTPSIGGNTTYLLSGGKNFYAFNQNGQVIFNVSLPNSAYQYSYSDVALAYGNAYVPNGQGLYVFGAGGSLNGNASMLSALGSLYLNGRGGLADYTLYSLYGTANLGLFINGTYAPSLKVAKYDGATSYALLSNPAALQSSGPFSISLWIDPANVPTAGQTIIMQNENYLVSGFRFGFKASTPNDICIWTTQSIPSGGATACSTNSLSINTWYHVVVTYNNSSLGIYLNGTNPVYGPGNYIGNTNKLYIGPAGGTSTYNGMVANIQIYNKTLSRGEIQYLYAVGIAGPPVNQSRLVGWWPLLGDANDYSGKGVFSIPYHVTYQQAVGYRPPSLSASVQIGGSATPVQLTSNGIGNIYNVSVVTWSS